MHTIKLVLLYFEKTGLRVLAMNFFHSKSRNFKKNTQLTVHFLFLTLISLFTLSGCTNSTLFVVNTLAGFDDFNVIENVSYGRDELNRLDIYIPGSLETDSETKQPAVIFFYGGCWGGCKTRNKEKYPFVAQALTSHGYIAVLADYRRYPKVKFPIIMEDAKHAVEWVRENIESYGGSHDRIFLMGHSAGAHLAVMLALNESYLHPETYNSVKGVIGLAGPYDFLPLTKAYQREVFGPTDNYPDSQPINFVDGTEPPLLLLYGNDDNTVKPHNIINLTTRVQQSGGHVEAHMYDNIDHKAILGALSIPYQDSEPVLKDIIHFLDQQSAANDCIVTKQAVMPC